ncbi:MAG: ABC transporter permease [Devosia sp.]
MSADRPNLTVAVAAGLATVAAVAIAILAAGASPGAVLAGIIDRAILSPSGFAEAVVRAIPLTLLGLAVAVAFRAQLYNIGADGQLLVGAALGVACAAALPANPFGLVGLLVLGALGGALWGGLAGILKARFGANEIIVTIMLNYVAIQLISYLVRGPLQESMGIFPRSDAIASALELGVVIEGTRIHGGLIIAVVAALVLAFVLSRTQFGFRLNVLGQNPNAARYAGHATGRQIVWVMALSGGLAGLAGIVEVSALYGRLQEGFAQGFGIAAIAVALVARLNPMAVPFSALLFAALYVGLGGVAREGSVPFPLINIIEAAVVFVFLIVLAVTNVRQRRHQMARAAQ